MDESRTTRQIWFFLGGITAFLVLLYFIRRTVTPFAIAFALAYLLDPLIDRLEKHKISRSLGIVVVLFALFLSLFLGGMVFIPVFQYQVHHLMENIPDYIGIMQGWVQPLLDQVSGLDSARVQAFLNEGIKKFGELPLKIVSGLSKFVWGSLSGLLNIVMMMINVILIPVALFYLLRDYDIILDKLVNIIPHRFRDPVLEVSREINQTLSKFVRGQLMVATLMALLYCLGLFICGTPLSLFIGILAGYANMVPYLGLVFGFLPAIVLTFLQYQEILPLVGVIAVFAIVQALEGMVITPRVVGDQIGLHPVIIMLAVLIGAEFFGILGILLAVPIAAVLNVVLKRSLVAYKKSELFNS